MLERLKWQLTMWFVGLSILLYTALSVAVVWVFDSGLDALSQEHLTGLSREIRPAIEYENSLPTLKSWADNIKTRDIRLLNTVQLFDPDGKLLEQYGPPGVPVLQEGELRAGPDRNANSTTAVRKPVSVTSRYRELKPADEPSDQLVGYLQIQESTKGRDDAMRQLLWTIALLAPFLVAGLGGCGYFFAGKALRPTEETLALLRRFVADAGHELNTPITVIQASVETLEKKLSDVKVQTDVLNVIRRASDRMAALGNDLMLLAKLESPQILSPIEEVRLDQVVDSVAGELKDAFESKNISINYDRLAPMSIHANAASMRTLVDNLIENALAYTEAGGTVSVCLEGKGAHIVLSVEDTGIGIPQDSLPRVFERFYRVDKSRSRLIGGSGLGLSIVKAIVDSHHGSVHVESTAGKGTKFTVILPAG